MPEHSFLSLFYEMAKCDNVVGVGRGHKITRGEDTGREAVTILVRKKYSRSDLQTDMILPRKIEGKPTDVIEVGDIRLFNSQRTELLRPAQPGISIGHYRVSAGTFGAMVRDADSGEPLILSNNHVLANLTDGTDGSGSIGDPILQPGLYDGGTTETAVIGHLHKFIPLYREVIEPSCKIAKMFESVLGKCLSFFQPQYRIQLFRDNPKVNSVDCAVAKPVDADSITPEIMEVGPVVGVKEPVVGMPVKKSGRSSGVTHSLILATDVTCKIKISAKEYAVFTEQNLAGPMSLPGDSGSLVLTEDNYVVGLLFAGSEQITMFNRMSNVLGALKVTF